jgi:hypothetical protein
MRKVRGRRKVRRPLLGRDHNSAEKGDNVLPLNVRYWHKADITTAPAFVRYWSNSGQRWILPCFVRF